MNQELEALEKKSTWELATSPPSKRAIASKWVYRLKFNLDGSIDWYMACLVAKEFNQIPGIDYFESFPVVAKLVTVRVFLAVAAAKFWPILQLNINNAFLHDFLDEDVVMEPLDGYSTAQARHVSPVWI
ncbi:UNVERIFIED_CONTAM: Retrovirus-related Pol polyprotein from transposon RE1 [Sesamum radiatum]|uniref:Retrovirus-related Pol polyprotein from transposon RE1 n=1 Tax=Sesamum radiatum TaxID=300843 RepID=A0AAW2JNA9_SESRA